MHLHSCCPRSTDRSVFSSCFLIRLKSCDACTYIHAVGGCTGTPHADFGLGASTNIVTDDIGRVPSVTDEGHRDPSA